MSKALSLKLREDVFADAEEIRKQHDRPRNGYINEAVAFYNRMWRQRMLRDALVEESRLIAEDSMAVLAEFEAFQEELPQ